MLALSSLMFCVSRLKLVLCSPLGAPTVPALPLRCIIDGTQYPVNLEGYSTEEHSWVPSRHILDTEFIRDYCMDRAVGYLNPQVLSLGVWT